MPTKRPFHHGNLKSALIDAALKVLDEDGPDAITIREVARRAGVSHAAPANHFADRRALLTEVAVVLFDELYLRIANAGTSAATPGVERVRAFATALMEYGFSDPQRYRMLWRRDLVDDADTRLTLAMDRIYDDLIAEISALPGAGGIDPDTTAIGLWSIAHGYISMRLDNNFEPAADSVTHRPREDAIIDAFLASLLTS